MKKEKKGLDAPTAPFWMTTYGDMVTLLFAFFVLLLSFANMDEIKFEQAAHSLQGALGVMEYESSMQQTSVSVSEEDMDRRMDIFESMVQLEMVVEQLDMGDAVDIEVTESGMLIQMGDQVLFSKGKANLKPEAFPILDIVGQSFEGAGEVLIEGHTDDTPINSAEFPSNWELSTTRALRVVKYLVNYADVDPNILGAVGFAEFRPIAPNDTPENQQKNRRVEFLVTWK